MELSGGKRRVIYLGCILLAMSVQLCSMGLNNTMFTLLEGLGGVQFFALMAVLSGLGIAITTVVGGRLGDIYGAKNIVLIGAVVSVVCELIMGLTGNLLVFIVARAILSLGTGTFCAAPFVICAQIYPPEKQAQIAGVITASLAAGIFLGSTISGIMVGAGMIFLSILYPGIVSLIGALMVFLNMPKTPKATGVKLDYAGMALLTVFLISICMAFSFAGSLGFTAPIILVGYAVAVVSLIALIAVENKAESPTVPMYLFKNKIFSGICILEGLTAIYQLVMGSYVPLTGQQVMGVSAAMTGFFNLPRTVIVVVLPAIAAVWISKKASRSAKGLAIYCVGIIVAFALFAFTNEKTPVWLPFVLLAVTGVGEAFNATSWQPLTMRQLDPKDIGVGIGLASTMATLGMTVIIAVIGSIFSVQSQTDINGALHTMYFTIAGLGVAGLLVVLLMLSGKGEKASTENN